MLVGKALLVKTRRKLNLEGFFVGQKVQDSIVRSVENTRSVKTFYFSDAGILRDCLGKYLFETLHLF